MNETVNPDVWFPNLGITINTLSGVAFELFGFKFYFYGLFIGLGVVAGAAYAIYNAKRLGQDQEIYADYIPYALIFSVIGARVYYVAFSWSYYKDNLSKIIALREGGLAIYGAVIAAVLTALVYTKIRKFKLSVLLDTAVPGLVIGQIIGRWGNFFNREAYGGFTDGIFAMRYRVDNTFFIPSSVLDKMIEVGGDFYIQVHPTFLYESVWNLGVFIFLHIYTKKKKFDSEIFALYLFFYGLGRAWIEGLRTDQLLIGGTNLAASQIFSIVLVVTSVVYILYMRTVISKRTDSILANAYKSPFEGVSEKDEENNNN